MTAAEARIAATEVNLACQEQALKTAKEGIAKAVSRGEFQATLSGGFHPGALHALKDEGYNVLSEIDRNLTYTVITW
jgi:hypothetical protein